MESTINQDQPICTVKSGTAPNHYSYMAQATTPACGAFMGTITVMAK
jgi:hypothetical protein